MCTTQHRRPQGRSVNPSLAASSVGSASTSTATISLPTLRPPVPPGPKGRGRTSGAGSLCGGLRPGTRSPLPSASPSPSTLPSSVTTITTTAPTIDTSTTTKSNTTHPSTARTVAPLAAAEVSGAAAAAAAGDSAKEMEPQSGNTYYRLQSSGGGSSSNNNNNNGTNTSNSSSNNSSNSSLGSSGGPGGREFNIAVLGAKGVGKSAIVVRYLTRRFIGDYDSQMDAIFTHSTSVDNKQVVTHIMDTPWHCPSRGTAGVAEDPVRWADGFLLVFSLTDPGSWATVQELVTGLRRARQDDRLPIAVAGNKSDLVYLRRLSGADCAAWCAEHGCAYREVSASEDPASVEEAFLGLCRQVRTLSRKREKLLWIMQRPAVAAKLQIRQSLRQLAEKTWRSRTSTF